MVNLYGKINSFLNSLASDKNSKPLYELSPKQARAFLNNVQSKYPISSPDTDIEDKTIQTPTSGNVKIRIIRPKNNKDKLPAILYLHGGGWILGNTETHETLIKTLSTYTNSAVIFVEYSLSPETVFPTAIEQAYEVLTYIWEYWEVFNIDKNRIAIAGDSAGGNMATVLSLKSANENGPKICIQALFYPVTDATMETESYSIFKDGPWLSKKAMEWFWDAYEPDKNLRNSPYLSPIYADTNDLKKLPKTLIITAENDVLRDEGEAYAVKLDKAGVETLCIRINGTIHDFMMLNALYNTPQTQCALTIACETIKKVLYTET